MDITIYLPDDLAHRAKARTDINLSRMLRDALIAKFETEEAMSTTLAEAKEVVLALETEDGLDYKGRLTGTLIATGANDVEIYLTDDENVLVYDLEKRTYFVAEDAEEALRGLLDDQQYIAAMNAIGIVPTIDLNVGG